MRCRDTPMPHGGTWSIDLTQQRLCGGKYQCDDGTYCPKPNVLSDWDV